MKVRVLALAPLLLMLNACKMKLETDKKDGEEKPTACAREAVAIPEAFRSVATEFTGATRNSACQTVAVGQDRNGDIIVVRYKTTGEQDSEFAGGSIYRPFAAQALRFPVSVHRLAVMPDGVLGLGHFTRQDGDTDLFAFKLDEAGYLQYEFGPRKEGFVRGEPTPFQILKAVEAPILEGQYVRITATYEDTRLRTPYTRVIRFPQSGREALPKFAGQIPQACDMINHHAFKDNHEHDIRQSTCSQLSWRVNGPQYRDNLQILANGTSQDSTFLGEFAVLYEGTRLVMMSHDGLGLLKKEYLTLMQGASFLCGNAVRPEQRYLVFSSRPPEDSEWQKSCWFL